MVGIVTAAILLANGMGVVDSSSSRTFNRSEVVVEHARPSLILEKSGAVPGEVIWVGLRFIIDEGWHLYWDGLNDTGMPVKAAWTVPPEVKMGSLMWPVPKREVYPLEIIDYIYEREVIAIAPITIGNDAKIGSTITIKANLKWLVCEAQCIPGKGEVQIEIPVIEETKVEPTVHEKLFSDVRSALPTPALVTIDNGENEQPTTRQKSPLKGKWERNTLILSVPNAQALVFYPDPASSTMTNAIRDGERKGSELRLEFEADEDHPIRASGIVEVRRAEPRKAEVFSISVTQKTAK
ncbi:MAG: protein-disulfide reductase DsbD domain-containing protein [Phycisphaerales bacterium]